MRLRTWDSLTTPNFVKKSLKGIGPLGADLQQKHSIFRRFWRTSAHTSRATIVKFWHEGADLGLPPTPNFEKNR